MSPLKELNPVEASLLERLLEGVGSPLAGQAFRVAFGDEGTERIIVVGENVVAADDDVLAAIGSLLTGAQLFRPISDTPTAAHPGINAVEFDPLMSPRDLFQGESVRIPNILKRSGIETVGEVLALLQGQDGEKSLGALKGVGPKTSNEIKRKLGLE